MDDWREWKGWEVLEHGLPPLPGPRLPPFNEAPIGVWESGHLGAVLFVYHDPDDRSMPYSQDIEILARSGPAGRRTGWRVASRGGSDWPVPFGDRPPSGSPVLTGFALGAKVRRSPGLWIASGIAPRGVTQVVATTADGATEVANVEPVSGAFLISTGERIDGVHLDAL